MTTAHGGQQDERLAVEFISVLGMPPVEFVHLAADLGVGRIGLALAPFTANPHGYPAWSLREDAGLRRKMGAALRERGVTVSLGEGFLIREGGDIAAFAGDMDLMAELGAERVNTVVIGSDRSQGVDQLDRFAGMARERGLQPTLEFMPMSLFPDLPAGLQAIGEVPGLKLVIDCMHLIRSGAHPTDLAAAKPGAIGYLQLCDVPLATSPLGYGEEGKHHRLPPGEGELPLAAILFNAPRDIPIGLELPQLSLAEKGVGPREQLEPALATTRRLLADIPQSVEPAR